MCSVNTLDLTGVLYSSVDFNISKYYLLVYPSNYLLLLGYVIHFLHVFVTHIYESLACTLLNVHPAERENTHTRHTSSQFVLKTQLLFHLV